MKLTKVYEPQKCEPRIYQMWETGDAFAPSPTEGKKRFSIVLPPPNANGNLHVGHALTTAIEDVMARYHRLRGDSTFYHPGADHAGFETWVVFEKQLQKEGKTRFDFSREELYNMVWSFVEAQRGNMEIQLRELGASLDWKHLTFTLDAKVISRTHKTFKQLWDDGLIYRGERIVNYCTYHQTSFADIEVEHQLEKSKLWNVAYTLVDKIGEIVVVTTRPETILGDTAIAVNPDDPRYKDMIGRRAWVPLTNREVPIIADEAVDPKFGTGAVKVTPAHDPTDFEIAQRHKLPVVEVIGIDGTMTGECPPAYKGLDVKEARAAVLKNLESEDALRGEQAYSHSVGHCYKCGTVIQPLIKDQWFLSIKPLAERAIAAIQSGDITFTPKSKAAVLVNYLNNLKDWNLSRQIPWGIPIPAFQSSDDHTKWIFNERVDQKTITVDGVAYHREEDTFDTWFSSGQWPFITTDYLEKGELASFYPLDVMETGADLIFPWVSRMIMLGLYATKQAPFRHVYFHGLVLDEHGQKMSKSKGNVINPQELIKEYGSDALRMGLLASRSAGINQAFSTGSVIAGRNFANKLWNMARFIEGKLGPAQPPAPHPQTIADHWVLQRLNKAAVAIGKLIETYRFAEAYELMYHTIWDDVADWYLEASKTSLNPGILAYVLQTSLQIAHPFAPFVTETIWQTLDWTGEGLLATANWPTPVTTSAVEAKKFNQLQSLVGEIRFVASGLGAGKQELLFTDDALIASNQDLICHLAHLRSVRKVGKGSGLRLAVAAHEAWLDIDTQTLHDHATKLEARLAYAAGQTKHLQARLANANYTAKAPAHVVAQTRAQLAESKVLQERLQRELKMAQS